MSQTIWKSIEVDCWGRGLDYNDYRKYHMLMKCSGEPLSLDGYDALCLLMDNEQDLSVK